MSYINNCRHFKKCLLALFSSLLIGGTVSGQNLTQYVDPFIGTGGHGHTYPGATVPFGMVQLSPDNGNQGWDWCSGYNYSSNTIAGFSHMHLSGTGVGDWCDISVMPSIGLIPDTAKDYRVTFSHSNEAAHPGYYSVTLDNGIKVALTVSERCGFHKYIFPSHSAPVIRFNLGFSINYDRTTEAYIRKLNDSTIVGYRYSSGWAHVQRVYFAARTSVPFERCYLYENSKYTANGELRGKEVNGELAFADAGGRPIMMKVALSTVSTHNALEALNEIAGWNFDDARNAAEDKWEHELEKIRINTSDDKLKHIFYTAFYHSCMAPVLYSDADGTYQNANGDVLKMKKGQRYTVFSLWDTFRGENPLLSIMQPERYRDMLNSMLAFGDEVGYLPIWDLSTWETGCMSGYHAIPSLADAVLTNYPGVDAERTYAQMRKSAFQDRRGTKEYIKYGFLPQDKAGNSASVTLEYAYDDWCIAQVAKKLNKMDDYYLFMDRSRAYQRLFDKRTGFIRAKNSDSSWVVPFDPYKTSTARSSMYEEGNAWQYTFFVPEDVRGLAKLYGSNAKFIQKLDSLFNVSSKVSGSDGPPDVSGLVGQYAHGNEPSHHIAYMYSYVGQPWKTQARVRMIVDSMYHDQPEGYAGNEDCGQMSAWAVWSILGFYPANAASGEYVFGSPVLDEAIIALPNGRQMTVRTENNAKGHPYIQSVTLNGKPYNKTYIDHKTLMQGGELKFVMSSVPNKKWGVKRESWPSSATN